MKFFPDPKEMELPPLIFMTIVYVYILMQGDELVCHGSEMLLLLSGPGLIGGLFIPIFSAIPDCIIILISGLGEGNKEEIEHEIKVGIGSLIGSTIMVLTIRWSLSIFFARKEIDPATDKIVNKGNHHGHHKKVKFSFRYNGVKLLKVVNETAKMMIYSTLGYLVVQIPALFINKKSDTDSESIWALADLIICISIFLIYCFLEYRSGKRGVIIKLEQEKLRREQWKMRLDTKLHNEDYQEFIFKKHDRDNSNSIDATELKAALAELGLHASRQTIQKYMETFDIGNDEDGDAGKKDGKISLNEFKNMIKVWLKEGKHFKDQLEEIKASSSEENHNEQMKKYLKLNTLTAEAEDHHDDEEHEEHEHHIELSDRQLKIKAVFLMILGAAICGVFSEPLVQVINAFSNKIQISPFYVSFVVSPLALNIKEIISNISYAKKKTTNSISLLLSSFNGYATMNSTLSLAVFLGIIYFRGLSWNFSAEVFTVVIVIIIVGVNSISKRIMIWQAFLVSSLYPLSILLVWVLKNYFDLD